MTGRFDVVAKSSGEAGTPRRTSREPSAATIAPLSVHSAGPGHPQLDAGRVAPVLRHRPQPGVRRHSPADAPTCSHAVRRGRRPPPCAVSTSTTASWHDAATSATGTGSPAASRASTQRATAVFSPEKEKS